MKSTPTALVLALFATGLIAAQPAAAQGKKEKSGQETAAEAKGPTVSDAARKQIVELQTAVNAKNTAAIPAALAAAQAKAKTKDDRYVIAKLQLKAAVDADDTPASTQAIDAVIASGYAEPAEMVTLYTGLGKLEFNNKAYDKSAAALEKALQINPDYVDALVVLAEARNGQNRGGEGVALIQKAIAAQTAAGQKAEENWYKRAVKLAYDAKLPTTPAIALDWVQAYPSAKNWREAIKLYQINSGLPNAALIDSMRLARALGALQGESDYYSFSSTLVNKGFPGEAKAVLDEGIAAKSIDKARPSIGQVYSLASTRSQGDRAGLAATATAARAAPDAKKAMVTGEAYYGYGDFAQAAEMFRVALTKGGVDKDLANLRLGMALLGTGDKAGATAAFNAAGGAQAAVAKLWLAYAGQKA